MQRDDRHGVIVNVSSDEAFVQWDDGKTGWVMLTMIERECATCRGTGVIEQGYEVHLGSPALMTRPCGCKSVDCSDGE